MTALCDEEPHILGLNSPVNVAYIYLPQLAHLTRPTGQLHATPPIQSGLPARRMPQSAAIHGHPALPCRLAASPSARVPPPIPARLSPRRLASPHLTWPTGQFPSPARTHATLRGTGRLPAWPPAVSAAGQPPPPYRCSGAACRPSCVQTFCGPKVIRGGRPPAHRVLATVSRGQLVNGLCRARRPGRPPCLDPLESSQRDAESIPSRLVSPAKSNGQLANEVGRKRRREGPLAHAGSPIPEAPSNRPALPDLSQQGYLTAYTTRLVTSVVCRGFIPARGDIAIRQPAPRGFSLGAVASLLRCMARRPIRIQLRRAGQHRRVPARILT
ncbi:hypothetical protein AAWM_08808 [Aspergillus awamori]|uniref:Uncharacterized protein n=1 Tax=Aspergillus awamori TaxID=105351 RepID=A0A401L311_ASPAW|nr:hypothetical protein AAWM_08808 [Aspergillus awamori]